MDRFVTPTSLMISSSSSATAVTSPSYPAHSPRITCKQKAKGLQKGINQTIPRDHPIKVVFGASRHEAGMNMLIKSRSFRSKPAGKRCMTVIEGYEAGQGSGLG